MGLHTGEPTVGDEGYLGLDVVRAAGSRQPDTAGRSCSPRRHVRWSATICRTAGVHDLGKQNLKDIQHEHVYELRSTGTRAHSSP